MFIGIDLGGTKIRAVLASESGEIAATRMVPTLVESGSEAVYSRVEGIVGELVMEASLARLKVAAIGLGAPGPLDTSRGLILVTENLPFINFPIVTRLSRACDMPVFLENDANVAALAEQALGSGAGCDPMVYLTASTGIGAGAIIGGQLLRGGSSNAMEAGHMTLEPGGPKCACGNRGCAEVLASGTAIAASARAAVEAYRSGSGKVTSLSRHASPGAPEVFAEADLGDAVAISIAEGALRYLGICAANLVTIFDPQVLVVGGGLAAAGKRVIEAVSRAVAERCAKAVSENCRVFPAALGQDSGTLGAVILAARALRNN